MNFLPKNLVLILQLIVIIDFIFVQKIINQRKWIPW